MSLENVKYDAFISYRHCELDSFISENLHKRLENYKLPKYVVTKLKSTKLEFGDEIRKTKIERVFRDEAELPLSNNLSDPITEALDNSDFLIVICTPRLPQSQWCKKEIETFVKTHDRNHVLLVLAEGEPEESFPEILMHEEIQTKDENGNEVTVKVDREPLAADCRGDTNKQRLKALDNVVLKLCAAIFNLNYDDLKQRHRERQIKRRLIAMSAALAIVSVFAITCLSFIIKISRQNRIISDKYAGAMASASEGMLSRGLRLDSLYAVRSVLPDDGGKEYNKDAYNALVSAIAPYEIEKSYFPSRNFRIPGDATGFSISDDKTYALVNCDGYFSVIDIASDKQICRVDNEYSDYAILNDTGIVYLDDNFKAMYLDPFTGEETVLSDDAYDVIYASGKDITLVFSAEGVTGFRGLSKAYYIDLLQSGNDDPDYSVADSYISDDGKYAAFALSGYEYTWVGYIDVAEGKLKKCIKGEANESVTVACDSERLYVYREEEDEYMGGTGGSVLEALDISTGEKLSCDIPGSGFFDMHVNDNGILIVSDRLSYLLDTDLNINENVTGYLDATCIISADEGYIILDARGRMYSDFILSGVDKVYSLYGHNDSDLIFKALYKDDEFFIDYSDSNRVVIYSPLSVSYETIKDIGDAKPYEDNTDMEVKLDKLEGIGEISIFNAAISDDGKYIAVNSNDGVLYVFDALSGKKIREVYNTGFALFHNTFPYLKGMDVYIIENRIFDKDFNMISTLPQGRLAALGKDQKSVVIESPYSLDSYYKITLLPYDEMIKLADQILGDHIPDDSICDKYQIIRND